MQHGRRLVFMLAAVTAATHPAACFADAAADKVIGVADGDTITIRVGGKTEHIRLHSVDCPEKNQPLGQKAKQFTSRLVFGKRVGSRHSPGPVRIERVTRDRYGRIVGKVYVDGVRLGEALVRAGLAWWYRKYAPKDKTIAALEAQARKARRGLWAQPNPTPPWEWRRARKKRAATRATAERKAAGPGGVLHGNIKSKVLHGPGCRHYDCDHCTARFASAEQATKAGYRPHKACIRTPGIPPSR